MRNTSHLQLRRDVGQLLWLGFDGSALSDALARALCFDETAGGAPAMAGAVVVFGRNISQGGGGADLAALCQLNRSLHDLATRVGERTPLWIAVDQEGGPVQRVRAPATVWPPMLSFERFAGRARQRAEPLAQAVGEAMGRELAALGFDVDFAPVLDVHSNPANPIIGDRAFATAPEAVADRALAFARGLARAGVLGCGKHFPGHGDTSTDSHLVLPRLDHDLERLRRVELAPFRRAVAAGVPMIMSAHVVFSALDDGVPATLSRRVMHDLLRQELGFRGIAVSDDFGMKAIAGRYGTGDAVVRAVRAGCDALLLCNDWAEQRVARDALIRAAESDSEVRARVAESAERIRRAKRRHVESRAASPAPAWRQVCGSRAHRELAAELARGS